MNVLTLDFETTFDSDYSLSKLTAESYVRDPRFEAHGVGVRFDDGETMWMTDHDKLRSFCDWSDTAVLCHHAQFDGLILSHHYGVHPARFLDTMAMARYLFPGAPASLEALATRFGLPGKSVPYDAVKGVRWADMGQETRDQLAAGCLRDCELTYRLFVRFMAMGFPSNELPLIDLTIKMFTNPRLEGDRPLLKEIAHKESFDKNERLYALDVGETDLASAGKFAALLEAEGVDVALKPGKLKPIPALAKTDPFMQELMIHGDERIRELAQARLDVKSTLAETRSARLGAMAARGRLCVYLHYCGAHTRRWSGGDGVNFQNLGRRSDLRRAIRSPDGYLLACPDQSQGECRILNWLAGQQDVVDRFRRSDDPYLPMASLIYGKPVTDPRDPRRQAGKIAELQLGFGSGWRRFQLSAQRAGVDQPVGAKLEMPDELAEAAVKAYRSSHDQVVWLWREADDVLRALAGGAALSWRFLEIRKGRIHHPSGAWLDYSQLSWQADEWRLYGRHGAWSKMYGAKLIENVVQWLSRIVTAEAMVEFDRQGYPVVGMAHDDVWLLCPDDGVDRRPEIIDIMSRTPSWAPGLPLAANCKMGKTYG